MSVKRMMRTEEGKLFGEALLEAVTWKLDDTLSQYNETVKATNEHDRRVQKIFRSYVLRRRRKMIAAIVAATLVLGGCAGYEIYKKEIGAFIEEYNRKDISVSYGDKYNGPTRVEYIYETSYIPEGYSLSYTYIKSNSIRYSWRNELDNYISLGVKTPGGASLMFSNDGEESELLYYKDLEIYRRKDGKQSYRYAWIKDSYLMTLSVPFDMSTQEIEQIIDGIHTTISMEEYEKQQASIIKPGRR